MVLEQTNKPFSFGNMITRDVPYCGKQIKLSYGK